MRTANMARKQTQISGRMLFTWCMLGGLILLFAPDNLTGKLQGAFAHLFRWPLGFSRSIALSAQTRDSLGDSPSERQYLNHIANLEERLRQEQQRTHKLAELRHRFGFEGASLLVADVITAFVDGQGGTLRINGGKNDGLAKGQFVLGDNSIIGTISDVGSHTAEVKLTTEPASKLAVMVARLDLPCVLQGCGNNFARLVLLSRKHKIKKGDSIVAQKSEFMDWPMIVGKVVHCSAKDDDPLLWDVRVEPVCDVRALSTVTVIVVDPRE